MCVNSSNVSEREPLTRVIQRRLTCFYISSSSLLISPAEFSPPTLDSTLPYPPLRPRKFSFHVKATTPHHPPCENSCCGFTLGRSENNIQPRLNKLDADLGTVASKPSHAMKGRRVLFVQNPETLSSGIAYGWSIVWGMWLPQKLPHRNVS